MGFTKLSDGILMSSVFKENEVTFKVWIALLASCKQNGISPCTVPFLACICRTTEEIVCESIKKLSSPDIYSKSKTDEGRRITEVDGGFFIINYAKYREYSLSDSSDATRKREYRKRDNLGRVPEMAGHSASASASASEDKKDSMEEKIRNQIPPSIESIVEYCNQRQNNIVPQKFFDHYQSKGWMVGRTKMKDWQAAIRTWESSGFNDKGSTKTGPKNCSPLPDQR